MAAQDDSAVANPDELMAGISSPTLLWTLLISVGVHLAVIFGTSIGYIHLMVQYRSLHPRFAIKQLSKDKREEEADAKRKAAYEKLIADQAKRDALEKAGGKGASEPGGEGKDKPTILKELEKKSGERPKESSVGLDDDLR